jgi:uncharacterized integral membrane protein
MRNKMKYKNIRLTKEIVRHSLTIFVCLFIIANKGNYGDICLTLAFTVIAVGFAITQTLGMFWKERRI